MMESHASVSRRRFLATSAKSAGACGLLLAGCAPAKSLVDGPGSGKNSAHKGSPAHGMTLGLDTYSVHRSLTARDPKLRRDLWWVLDRLDELGLRGVQIDPSHFPGSDEATLGRLASIVGPRGQYVEFGMGGWDIKRMEERIRLTARFGGRALRTFCGGHEATPEKIAWFLEVAPPAFRQIAETAERHNVDVAIENHGDFTSVELKELLDRVGHPRIGACLDTGNSLYRGEDPLECARRLAPYARSMHLKDWTTTRLPDGSVQWKEAVPGAGAVPVADILRLVAARKRAIYIALECPVQPSEDEAETVEREWRHVKACAAAARRILARLA